MKKGTLIFLVGNSGSGKDSLLNEALKDWPQDRLPVKIPKRYITRLPHESEPFISLTPEQFNSKEKNGDFCFSWYIYGLHYGISKEIFDWIDEGHNVIVNVSREIISEAKSRYPEIKVIFVQVPFEITLERIKNRGREEEDDPIFKERVERSKNNQIFPGADFIVDNVGDLAFGAKQLREILLSF